MPAARRISLLILERNQPYFNIAGSSMNMPRGLESGGEEPRLNGTEITPTLSITINGNNLEIGMTTHTS